MALVRRLSVDQRVGPKAGWILTCLYSSKLSMLFITSRSVLWVSAVLLLAATPPLLLYRDKSKGASRMKTWEAYFHASVVAFSAWFCRETLFEALQWWNGRPPSDGLLLGSYILLTGGACMPLVAIHFPYAQSAKRFLVLVVATGLLFVIMQPPVKLFWVYRSELITAAHVSGDDTSIYGFIASKPSWSSWLLIATLVLTLAAVTSIIPVKYVVELRALYIVGVGMTLGIYISALFPVTYLLEGQLRAKSYADEDEAERFTNMLAIEGHRKRFNTWSIWWLELCVSTKSKATAATKSSCCTNFHHQEIGS